MKFNKSNKCNSKKVFSMKQNVKAWNKSLKKS